MVNLDELSAKELYELAQKKEQEEALQEKLLQRIHELEASREQINVTSQNELKEIDTQIEELTKQRQAAVAKHNDDLEELNQELEKLAAEVEESQLALAEASSAEEEQRARQEEEERKAAEEEVAAEEAVEDEPTVEAAPPEAEEETTEPTADAEPPAKTSKPSGPANIEDEAEELLQHIMAFMKGRSYISESLLKEKLQVVKFKPGNPLNKLLDLLLKQARLVRRNGNNFVLGRVRGK